MTRPNHGWEDMRGVFPPDIMNALSHNLPPPPGVLQSARASRHNPTFFKTAIDQRIKDITEQMVILQAEKDKLVGKEHARAIDKAWAAICSPARRLHPDIMREIAYHAMDDYPSPAGNRTPLNLAHVSSTWRDVVLASPRLWTSLYLRIKAVDRFTLSNHIQVLKVWFQRAASLSVNLFIYVDCRIGNENNAGLPFNMFLKAIAPLTSQIRHLGIGGQHCANLLSQFVDIRWDFDRLLRLDILGQKLITSGLLQSDLTKLESVNERITLFHGAKLLTSIIAHHAAIHDTSCFQFIPWHQVTHVALDQFVTFVMDTKRTLRECLQLRTASLSLFTTISHYQILLGSAAHSVEKLEKLQLTDIRLNDYKDLSAFFSRILFPNLTHLDISIGQMANCTSPDEIVTLPGDILHFPSLRSLFIRGDTEFPTDFLLKFLRSMSQLRTLNLEVTGDLSDTKSIDLSKLCQAMTITNSLCDVLPVLEECSFARKERGPNKIQLLDVVVIGQFIHSRTHNLPSNCSSLKKISFLGNFGFMADLSEHLACISLDTTPVHVTVQHNLADDCWGGLHLEATPFSLDNSRCDFGDMVGHRSHIFA